MLCSPYISLLIEKVLGKEVIFGIFERVAIIVPFPAFGKFSVMVAWKINKHISII
jgi:hypothetical protein